MPKTKIAKQNTVIETETLILFGNTFQLKYVSFWNQPLAYGRRMHFLLGKNRENWSNMQLEQVNDL